MRVVSELDVPIDVSEAVRVLKVFADRVWRRGVILELHHVLLPLSQVDFHKIKL